MTHTQFESREGNGAYYLDTVAGELSDSRWYSLKRTQGRAPSALSIAQDRSPQNNLAFSIDDRPAGQSVFDASRVPAGATASYFALQIDFDTSFAVRTTDKANGADQVYVQRADNAWSTSALGYFQNGQIPIRAPDDPDGPDFMMQNGGSRYFSEISDGSVVDPQAIVRKRVRADGRLVLDTLNGQPLSFRMR